MNINYNYFEYKQYSINNKQYSINNKNLVKNLVYNKK